MATRYFITKEGRSPFAEEFIEAKRRGVSLVSRGRWNKGEEGRYVNHVVLMSIAYRESNPDLEEILDGVQVQDDLITESDVRRSLRNLFEHNFIDKFDDDEEDSF